MIQVKDIVLLTPIIVESPKNSQPHRERLNHNRITTQSINRDSSLS